MKRFLIGTILVAAAVPVFAQDEAKLDIHAGLNLATKDVWRGINLVDDLVVTPDFHFTYGNWYGFVSGRMELSNTNTYATLADPTGNITAMRGGLFYTFDYDSSVDITVGVMAHQYPDVGTIQTQELYYGFEFGGAGNFMIEFMQDVQAVKGYYVRLSASNSFPGGMKRPNGDAQPITLGGHIAYGSNRYNSFYHGANTSTLADLAVWLETEFDVSDDMTVTPYVEYAALVDPDLKAGSAFPTNLYAGVRFHFKF